MKYLLHSADAACYSYSVESPAQVFVCSTVASRKLLTDPVVSGHQYRSLLGSAVSTALTMVAEADPKLGEDLKSEPTTVVNVLRGGLSFGVESALSHAFKSPEAVSFVGTDRSASRPLGIAYERWEFPERSVLVLGDIIGTGATAEKVLRVARSAAHDQGKSIGGYLVVTVGSRHGVERLQRYFAELAEQGDRFSATIVSLEALFDLPDPAQLSQAFPQFPFDFLRSPQGSTPEFELHRLSRWDSLFEKCAIYDGGMRAYTPGEHELFRTQWWTELQRLETDNGLTLAELGRRTAGVGSYSVPFGEWVENIGWAAPDSVRHLGIDHAHVHALGQRAHRYAETTSITSYVATRLCGGVPPR